jgi:hypothetical protein
MELEAEESGCVSKSDPFLPLILEPISTHEILVIVRGVCSADVNHYPKGLVMPVICPIPKDDTYDLPEGRYRAVLSSVRPPAPIPMPVEGEDDEKQPWRNAA